jgi:uncharacterized SAM-binding protein YcdF (DUF218 family)
MENLEMTAKNMNILGDYCGKRDLKELTQEELEKNYGFPQADVMVLFGGSILCGGDIMAQAIQNQVAKTYIIVGGAGHTTETFRQKMHKECPDIETAHLAEAEIFEAYLEKHHHVKADLLETESTNCGNNITYLYRLMKQHNIPCHSIILSQDATMQRRMDALLRRFDKDVQIINYATYHAEVCVKENQLTYAQPIWGMWNIDRYLSLLMGEIVRLQDNEEGYGPKGKNFLDHIDIPQDVLAAFHALEVDHANLIRKANPKYASKE